MVNFNPSGWINSAFSSSHQTSAPSSFGQTVSAAALLALSFLTANLFDQTNPGLATAVRLIGTGGGLFWLFKNCCPTSHHHAAAHQFKPAHPHVSHVHHHHTPHYTSSLPPPYNCPKRNSWINWPQSVNWWQKPHMNTAPISRQSGYLNQFDLSPRHVGANAQLRDGYGQVPCGVSAAPFNHGLQSGGRSQSNHFASVSKVGPWQQQLGTGMRIAPINRIGAVVGGIPSGMAVAPASQRGTLPSVISSNPRSNMPPEKDKLMFAAAERRN